MNLQAEWRQPLLQGAGVQFNRIAGPGATPGNYNGVMLARINTDIALADFEAGVRNLVNDVEDGLLGAVLLLPEPRLGEGRPRQRPGDVAEDLHPLPHRRQGRRGRERGPGPRAILQFLRRVESLLAATDVAGQFRHRYRRYQAESKLRYLMGLAATDGRLIRPKDEPTTAKVSFDWCDVLNEGLVRNVELRQQKWIVKRRELELIAAKNFLLPKLDFDAQYRWLGLGNDLLPDAQRHRRRFHRARLQRLLSP